jgi:hypothetical protein
MGAFINIGCYLQMHGLRLTFFDPDDYMRLVRIKEFFSHYDLSNNIIFRCNVPFGCNLHWTRFYDFFIIIPVYILDIFINSIDKSIEYVGFLMGPVIKSVTIVVFLSISQKLMEKDNAFLLTAIFAAHPLILPFGILGRPDHHAFIMLFILIFIHHVMDVIGSGFKDKNSFIKAAITTVLSVWISPETLIPLLLTDGILFLYSFQDVDKLRLLYMKNILVTCGIGGIIFLSSGPVSRHDVVALILVMTLFYTVYDGKYLKNKILTYGHIGIIMILLILFSRVTPVEYDRISIVHAALYLGSATYFGVGMIKFKSQNCRLLVSFLWLGIISTAFLSMYLHFLKGMNAHVSDYIKNIWLDRIAEMQSPFTHGEGIFFVIYCIIAGISIVNKIIQLTKKKFSLQDLSWWILIVNAFCYTIFAGMFYRMLPYSTLFGLPFIIDWGMRGNFLKSFHRSVKVVITSFLSIFFLFWTSYFDSVKQEKTINSPYASKELFKVIDDLSRTSEVIMAHSNDGPSILYYTKHKVVGAPYHRQTSGIIFSHRVMEDEYKEETVKSILKLTNTSYIFIRKSQALKAEQKSLASMIVHNELPQWASIVKLPPKFNDILVAKIHISALDR